MEQLDDAMDLFSQKRSCKDIKELFFCVYSLHLVVIEFEVLMKLEMHKMENSLCQLSNHFCSRTRRSLGGIINLCTTRFTLQHTINRVFL